MPQYISVALPIPAPRLFTYVIPDVMHQNMLIGVRVLVKFSRRTLTGIIVEELQQKPQVKYDIQDVLEVLDIIPIFSRSMLALTKWVAEYYMASWGETLKGALPKGMSPQNAMKLHLVQPPTDEELASMERRAPKRADVLRAILAHKGDLTVGSIEHSLKTTSIAPQIEALEAAGFITCLRSVQKQIESKKKKAVSIAEHILHETDDDGNNPLFKEIIIPLESSAPKQALALSTIYLHALQNRQTQEVTPLLVTDIIERTKVSRQSITALVQKGYIEEFETEVFRDAVGNVSAGGLAQRDEQSVSLTIEQEHAIVKISEALEAEKYKPFLLHGVTGSGKTLIYIEIIRRTIAKEKNALVLVPEIALTPQLIDRFKAFFPDQLIVFHSKMSAGERFDAWQKAREGIASIVIGVRSAIFAPLPNVGIVIVDEEHESSYKQDAPAPRYHARDCAIMRGVIEHAVVVLGSATPSIESMFNAQTGKYHLLEIKQRADGANMPNISVVNTTEERKKAGMMGVYSKTLLAAIGDCVRRKEGVILFHNRRGFASYLECFDCGDIPMCPNCSVTLTYHRVSERLRCHYCGYGRDKEEACTRCGSMELRTVGAGTQRLEDELKSVLEKLQIHATIQRMDGDATTKKHAHREILTKFSQGEIDILLGTQMVTKGMDIARVSLVGVVNADLQLSLPDFRASERTFQLLTQVAGRAGRSKDIQGKVLIQTSQTQHQAILATVAGNYSLFFNDELQTRKEAHYPPFSRFVVIEFSGRIQDIVFRQAHHFGALLPRHDKSILVLGPAAPTIVKLRSEYRYVIILKNLKEQDPLGKHLRDVLLNAHQAYHVKHSSHGVRITMDIDSSGFV
jgi:primosomal protein N' (replication factor Y)